MLSTKPILSDIQIWCMVIATLLLLCLQSYNLKNNQVDRSRSQMTALTPRNKHFSKSSKFIFLCGLIFIYIYIYTHIIYFGNGSWPFMLNKRIMLSVGDGEFCWSIVYNVFIVHFFTDCSKEIEIIWSGLVCCSVVLVIHY